MACGKYQDELRELAAGSLAPSKKAEVRVHLAGCAACCQALEEEKRLFATVDAELRQEMNAEVPASLAARIRIAAAEQPKRLPRVGWPWAAAVGMAMAAIVIAVTVTRREVRPLSPNGVEPARESARRVSPATPQAIERGSERAASPRPKHGDGKSRTREPEVLVLASEQAAFSQFAESLQGGGNGPRRLLEEGARTEAKPLQIAPVEVAELEIKPLDAVEGKQEEKR